MDWGLRRHVLYRIPASSVSYSPELANQRVWFTGAYRTLPAAGGTMAEFQFACDGHTWHGQPRLWLRPFAVVTVDR